MVSKHPLSLSGSAVQVLFDVEESRGAQKIWAINTKGDLAITSSYTQALSGRFYT